MRPAENMRERVATFASYNGPVEFNGMVHRVIHAELGWVRSQDTYTFACGVQAECDRTQEAPVHAPVTCLFCLVGT